MKNYEINGFTFSAIGDLIHTPEKISFMLLKNTYDALIIEREYIKASRIAALDIGVTTL